MLSRLASLLCLAFGLAVVAFAASALAAETLRIDLPVDAGTTRTQTVAVANHGGRLVRLWSDNALSTATLHLSLSHHPDAPALYTATLPTTSTAWFSPDLPLPNALSLHATLTDTPTTTGRVGVLMLIERD